MARTIAYVSNAESKEIFAFEMDPEIGTLSLLERTPVPGTNLPSPTRLPMAISPDRRFLYAALRSPPFAASSFGIDPSSGRLSHLVLTPLLGAMAYIVTDRTGRFLLAASYTDARLAIYPIGIEAGNGGVGASVDLAEGDRAFGEHRAVAILRHPYPREHGAARPAIVSARVGFPARIGLRGL
jgi:6-phosphogluconolactonase